MDANTISSLKTALLIIPKYDGNPNQLNRFITTCQSILTQFYNRTDPECFNNTILLHSILNRLEGKAEEIVNINGVSSWDHMKLVLLKNFGDQRDENCLNRDLVNMRQENETPQEFYNRCMNILNTIINYVTLHETEQDIIKCKRIFFQSQTLKTFMAGLKEPLGSTIRAMRPSDMPTALNYIKEEENIRYAQRNLHFRPPVNNNKPLLNNNTKVLPFGDINKPLQTAKPFNTQQFRPFSQFNRNNNQAGFVKGNFRNYNYNDNSGNRPQYPYRPPQQGSKNQHVNNLSNIKSNPEPMSGISHQSALKPLRQSINNHSTHNPSAAAFSEFAVDEANPNIAHAMPPSSGTSGAYFTDNDAPCASYSFNENNCYEYNNEPEYFQDEHLLENSDNIQYEQNFREAPNVLNDT